MKGSQLYDRYQKTFEADQAKSIADAADQAEADAILEAAKICNDAKKKAKDDEDPEKEVAKKKAKVNDKLPTVVFGPEIYEARSTLTADGAPTWLEDMINSCELAATTVKKHLYPVGLTKEKSSELDKVISQSHDLAALIFMEFAWAKEVYVDGSCYNGYGNLVKNVVALSMESIKSGSTASLECASSVEDSRFIIVASFLRDILPEQFRNLEHVL